MHGHGRSLASPAFAHDGGAADAGLRALLAAPASSPAGHARLLRSARLLASVVAVLDEVDGHGGEKDSHMAVVSMLNDRGERGLLAFTGTDSLAAWNPDARPVPALGRDIARSALADGAQAVIVDVAGPHRVVITGVDLEVLADSMDLEVVLPLLQAVLAPMAAELRADLAVLDARGLAGEVDVLVEVKAQRPDGPLPADLVHEVAAALSARPDIHRLVPGGIGVMSLPPTGPL